GPLVHTGAQGIPPHRKLLSESRLSNDPRVMRRTSIMAKPSHVLALILAGAVLTPALAPAQPATQPPTPAQPGQLDSPLDPRGLRERILRGIIAEEKTLLGGEERTTLRPPSPLTNPVPPPLFP